MWTCFSTIYMQHHVVQLDQLHHLTSSHLQVSHNFQGVMMFTEPAQFANQSRCMDDHTEQFMWVSANLCLANHLAWLFFFFFSSALYRSPTMATFLWMAILVVTLQDLSHTDQSGPSLLPIGLMQIQGLVVDVCTMEKQHLPVSVLELLV